jgi:hypothetical protein
MAKKYTGVSYDFDRHHYVSKVLHKGKTYRCGFFETEKEAAIARDKMIITHGLDVKLQVLSPVKKTKKVKSTKRKFKRLNDDKL